RKALERGPRARYATAGELADDLQRFLEDKPIRARRPSWMEQAWKWARRNRPVVWSAAAALLVIVAALGGLVAWVVRDQGARQARIASELQATVEQAQQFQREGRLPEALTKARYAEVLLANDGGSRERRQAVRELLIARGMD